MMILYEHNIYHSDIKPANIIFFTTKKKDNKDLKLKLIDFGASSDDYKIVNGYTPVYFPDPSQVNNFSF